MGKGDGGQEINRWLSPISYWQWIGFAPPARFLLAVTLTGACPWGRDDSLFRLLKIGKTQGFFIRCSHRGGNGIDTHLPCSFTVVITAVERIRKHFHSRQAALSG